MKSFKPIFLLVLTLIVVILLIPAIIVIPFAEKANETIAEETQTRSLSTPVVKNDVPIDIPVYRMAKEVIENIPLEEYVIGVVASEMPYEFETEALKAQALAARTYVIQQMLVDNNLSTPKGAKVTDSFLTHQAYKDNEELMKQWGTNYEENMKKFTEAVNSTAGQILTYNGLPIDASYFSTSNGYTENSEEWWANKYPYLRSVPSPWDEKSKKYKSTNIISVSQFEKKLGVKLPSNGEIGKILSRTTGNRVAIVKFGDQKRSGREVRTALELPSSDFTWERKGNQVLITTKGYGHGVGMSQYGANGMAQEGKTYQDIVTYYYQGVDISLIEPYIPQITAAK